MENAVIVNPMKRVMLLVPICALVLLSVSVYLISRSSDNVADISNNVSDVSVNFERAANNAISLAEDMEPTTIEGRSYMAFPEENVSQIIANRGVLTAERDAMQDERDKLNAERDRLTRDTTITITLAMFFVVASFVLAFFLPGSKPGTAEEAEPKSSE